MSATTVITEDELSEIIYAARIGHGHVSQLHYEGPIMCPSPKPVKVDSMVRGIRNAFSVEFEIQDEGNSRLAWIVTAMAKPNALSWPQYLFRAPSREHVRGMMFAEKEAQELDFIANRGKPTVRKTIDG